MLLASGGEDGMVQVWSTTTGEKRHSLAGGEDAVTAIAFRPSNGQIAIGDADGYVRVWSPKNE